MTADDLVAQSVWLISCLPLQLMPHTLCDSVCFSSDCVCVCLCGLCRCISAFNASNALCTVSERKIGLPVCGLIYPPAIWGEIREACFVLYSCSSTVESTTGKMIVALAIKHSWSKHYVFFTNNVWVCNSCKEILPK